MAGLIVILSMGLVLAVLDLAALRWGVDSRDGFADPRMPVTFLGLR